MPFRFTSHQKSFLAVAVFLIWHTAQAHVPVFTNDALRVDPAVDLVQLHATGDLQIRIEREGAAYHSDASAVLDLDFPALQKASVAYDQYTDFNMPHLKESRIVEQRGSEWVTWTHLDQAPMSSQHYLSVTIKEAVQGPGTFAAVWQLVQDPLPQWPFPNKPAFREFSGSWYMKEIPALGRHAVYIRYALTNEVSSLLPSWLISGFVKSRARSGVKDVILTLAREASVRH